MFVYADNAGTTSVSKTALEAMLPYLTQEWGNPSSVYGLARGALRLSIGEDNTMQEIDHILRVVPEAVARLRAVSPVWKELEEGKRLHLC